MAPRWATVVRARNKSEKFKFAPKMIADGEALREGALAGCGVIRVLAWEIVDQLQSGALLQLLPDWNCLGGLPIVAIYRKARPTQSRINIFLQHLTKEFRRHDNVIGKLKLTIAEVAVG